jgi:CCR4-NOT transcriptional regulation complex NOT5 subunit
MISNIEDIVGNYKKNISNIEIAENEDREWVKEQLWLLLMCLENSKLRAEKIKMYQNYFN